MCPDCGKCFVCRQRLKKHEFSHHPELRSVPLNDDKFECEICGQIYSIKQILAKHDEVFHKGLKNHSCDQCGKAFGRLNTLRIHILRHSRLLPITLPTVQDRRAVLLV